MIRFEILVGSMLGATEYVADAVGEKFDEHAIPYKIHLTADLHELDKDAVWLLCSSTHGAGDLPDNIQPFAEQLEQASLAQTRFLVIALGDSSYDTFCEGGKKLHELMSRAGAKALSEPVYIDVLAHPIPEDEAVRWLEQYLQNTDLSEIVSAQGAVS